MTPALRYLAVRAVLFLAPFAVLLIARVPWGISLPVSILFAFAASLVFFPKLREEAAADMQRIREGRKSATTDNDDTDVEDAVVDRETGTDEGGEPGDDTTGGPGDGGGASAR